MAIRIGVICPSNIAYRRFLPALKKSEAFEYVGVAYATPEEWFGGDASGRDTSVLDGERQKAEAFAKNYGGKVFEGYGTLLASPEIDAAYLPLPPALHAPWGKRALDAGKHLFIEKPFTTSAADTQALLLLAREKNLAVHENYMFVYHRQIAEIQKIVASGELGEPRLIRASFGFPFRGAADFRYHRALGGGALLDCGGYTLRLARLLLGGTARVVDAKLCGHEGLDVDLYGNAVLRNDAGLTAQVSFGMDNSYQCKLEIWGSRGRLTADRVFTPPADLSPALTVETAEGTKRIEIAPDDQFQNSLSVFADCIADGVRREERMADIAAQSRAVEDVQTKGEGA